VDGPQGVRALLEPVAVRSRHHHRLHHSSSSSSSSTARSKWKKLKNKETMVPVSGEFVTSVDNGFRLPLTA
jgi:hypothetical protein